MFVFFAGPCLIYSALSRHTNLASSAPLSPSPRAHLLHPSWSPKIVKLNQNTNSPFHRLFISTPISKKILTKRSISSPSFPYNLKLPSLSPPISIILHPLSDSTDENLIENPKCLANIGTVTIGVSQIPTEDSTQRIFIQDPPWVNSLFMRNMCSISRTTKQRVNIEVKEIERRKYHLLRRRQIKAETEAWEKMVEEYKELEKEMCEKKLAPHLPYVKKLFLGWFEPLREAIAKEQKSHKTTKHKAAYSPHIDCLPPDKMAVIVMHKMMGFLMMGQEGRSVRVVQAAVQIGVAIEQEVRLESSLSFFFIYGCQLSIQCSNHKDGVTGLLSR